MDRQLIDACLSPAAFDYPVDSVELIETHISWVILTDRYAYKIKKPLDLGFLDFRTLDDRRFFCDEEIRLNKASAPDIYIDVVPITDGEQPRFGGQGVPVDYAVRMHRFEQDQLLDAQLENNLLTGKDMKELGNAIASRHKAAARVADSQREHQLAITRELIWDNFQWLPGCVDDELIAFLHNWTERELQAVNGLLEQRFDDGFVRECHGDLHLANLVRMPGGIRSFDCIEFNADLRNADVICDAAFLVMDLVSRDRHDLAACFLNRYLEHTGDYPGTALLDLYFVYRCLVRAKVAAISGRESAAQADRDNYLARALRYCDLARRQAVRQPPRLIVMHGLSGTGKTWVAESLMTALPAIRIRSDIERKRMFGFAEHADTGSAPGQGIYSPGANEAVYEQLCQTARTVLDSGHNVILDASFLHKAQRSRALQAARDSECHAVVIDVRAPAGLMQERIAARARNRDDASEANRAVVEQQRHIVEPVDLDEGMPVIVFDNTGDADTTTLVDLIKAKQAAGCREANGT